LCTLSTAAIVPFSARQEQSSAGKSIVTFADAFSGRFGVARTTLQWTSQGKDGTYVDADSKGNLNLANIVTGNSTVFVDVSELAPAVQSYYDYSIQPSG